MRDILLVLIVFGSIPLILKKPYIGIVLWTWISFMNPHRLTWSFGREMPFAMVIALVTIIAFLISRESKKMPWDSISVLMLIYVLWTGITTIFALETSLALQKWTQFNKSILMVFLMIIIMRSPERIKILIWATVISVGFYTIKGGIFTIVTGGDYRVWGPLHSAFRDNNTFALAAVMIIPLFHYLATVTANKWVKIALYAGLALSVVSVFGTYSRGGLLGVSAMLVTYWWNVRQKWAIGGIVILAILIAIPMMPQKWFDRMSTIETYQQDASATNRLEIWGFALELAARRPVVGGGFNTFQGNKAYQLLNSQVGKRNVHSAYFEALGEHGIVGFFLFLLLGIAGLRTGTWISHRTKDRADLANEFILARMIKVSLVSYAVTGAFLNVAHYDLYYHLLAIMLLNKLSVQSKLETAPAAVKIDFDSGGTFIAAAGSHDPIKTTSYLRKKAR